MGTTSFRTADFNQKIERQLTLLSKFWEVHTNAVWSGNDEIQSLYYDFMKDNDFLTGDAPNKPKDAREKTSGLIDLGLIDNERRPTAAGESLRQVTSNGDFRPNNLLQIPADSYIYFKQMLKTSNDVDGEIVRPFVVLVTAGISHTRRVHLSAAAHYHFPKIQNNRRLHKTIAKRRYHNRRNHRRYTLVDGELPGSEAISFGETGIRTCDLPSGNQPQKSSIRQHILPALPRYRVIG